MSIFNDYSHQILHHQSERELIRTAELNRMVRESRRNAGSGGIPARIRRFFGLQTGRTATTLAAPGAGPDRVGHHHPRHHYAH